ncbi:Gfo/Idh/MocA family protein [Agathobaculum desmolans]|mgnify:CR=1 FL=1|uniref:Gfo/Idh/MocA family protein n=1 Tax=Agathobaculum desmolans TaxID=39484 RepID=UPI00248E9472|nr:Gfo/Idh/MocA family oxidoreductase [Agathobaculum desmolans]
MQQMLRVGVIGLGLIGSLHARIMAECPSAELVAVADINPQTAEKVAKCYGCAAYTDFRKMCDQEKLDAVCICTPDQFHLENAEYAAQKGLHLLIEKPIAPTEQQARQIVQAVENAGVRMMVAHVLHFDPRYAQLEETVRQGCLGEIIHMFFRRTNPRSNGRRLGGKVSIFYFIGVHDFEMMCACMDSRPVKAYSQRVSKVNADIGCEDTVLSTITFENGAVATIELCWALPENTALGINTYAEIVGTEGAGYVNIMDQGVSVITKDTVEYPDTLHWPEYNGKVQGDLKEELHHFVEATLEDKPYLTNTETAITAVRVIEACFESIKTGMPVEI